MTRNTIVLLLASVTAIGCKGETVVKDNPDTLRDLDTCKKTVEEKNKLITAIQDENARLMRGQGQPGDVVVSIEGNALTIKANPPGTGGTPQIDDKLAAAASKEFIDLVQRSRGAIQKCYEQALKKNSNLQAKTVTLTVSASFSPKGEYRDSNFSATTPLGDTFDSCMKTIAGKWQLKENSPSMTFKAQVSLTPS